MVDRISTLEIPVSKFIHRPENYKDDEVLRLDAVAGILNSLCRKKCECSLVIVARSSVDTTHKSNCRKISPKLRFQKLSTVNWSGSVTLEVLE